MPEQATLKGEISRMPAWGPIRVILTMTGLILIKGILQLIARYLLAIKGVATAATDGSTIALTAEWTLFGRRIRRTKSIAPVTDVNGLRFENRQRYLYLLVGFGALVVGTLVGMQWFLDGLKAGYPYLTLVGAAIVAAGVITDLCLFLLIPKGPGRTHAILAVGPWIIRLTGVETTEAQKFAELIESKWKK